MSKKPNLTLPDKRPVGVDLFCGAGGLSLGFEQAGFNVVAGIDSDLINVETHARNFPSCTTLHADITKLSGDDIRARSNLGARPIDVLFGGPPCTGFSMIGKRRPDDPRNRLLYEFARLVRELRPSYFVVENVEGLAIGHTKKALDSFLLRVKKAGYAIVEPIVTLNAQDFGVPQRRKRIFILGYLKDLQPPGYPQIFPKLTDHPANDAESHTISEKSSNRGKVIKAPSPANTVWHAISDLHFLEGQPELFRVDTYQGTLGEASEYARVLRGELPDPHNLSVARKTAAHGLTGCLITTHTAETIRRFEATKPGKFEPISRFYRLSKEGVAPTLRAGSDRAHGSFMAARPIHPESPRCITVREAARLHSFPDWFSFHGTRWNGFRQVGNSVPPLLARAVGSSVLSALNTSKGK